jgi:HSP20 family molecular chaperone IbpA
MAIGSIPPSSGYSPKDAHASRAGKVKSRLQSQPGDGTSGDPVRLQREASEQAAAIQGQINQINVEGQQNEDRLKQEYGNEYDAESVREEAAIEAERSKGYESLRALQRQNQAEEKRIQRQGEEDVANLQEKFKTETARTYSSGERELKDVQTRYAQQQQYEHARGESEVQTLQKDNITRTTTLKETNEQKLAKLNEDYQKRYEEKRAATELATEQSTRKIEARHHKLIAEHQLAESRVAHEANRQLEGLRADTARKLAAYQDRQSDPFYKMTTLDAEFHDESDRYVIFASVPAFEQPNVKVSVSGNKLIISGQRRNEEKLDLGPGHSQSTSSFQSFSETFPILGPIDANGLVRESDGDFLKITVPKKLSALADFEPTRPKSDVRRAALEKPHFPANLPHVAHEDEPAPKAELPSDPVPPDTGAPGSGPLSVS